MATEIIKNKVPNMTIEVTTKDGTSMGTFTGGSALSIKQFIEGHYPGFIRVPNPAAAGSFLNINSECICVVTEALTWTEEDLDTGWETWGCCVAPDTVPVTGLTVNPSTLSGDIGGNDQLSVAVAPDNATNKAVTYTSDDPTVATVDANGKVTYVAAGTTYVIVSTVDGGIVQHVVITVNVPAGAN